MAETTFDQLWQTEESRPAFIYWLPWSANVNSANAVHWALFNPAGSGYVMRVHAIVPIVDIAAAVTGIGLRWELIRTSSAPTGGTVITARPWDTVATLMASIECQQKPTGGAASNYVLKGFVLHSEETQAVAPLLPTTNLVLPLAGVRPLTVRPGEGLKCTQVTASAVGQTGFSIVFTLE